MTQEITMVRIYLSESRDHYERVVNWLHDDGRVKGVSVFRAIEGFGEDRLRQVVDMRLRILHP